MTLGSEPEELLGLGSEPEDLLRGGGTLHYTGSKDVFVSWLRLPLYKRAWYGECAKLGMM